MSENGIISKVFTVLQKVGRSFFLPISILPVAGLLLGIGASFSNMATVADYGLESIMGAGTFLNYTFIIMSAVGGAVFANLPLIFAMSVALGMANEEKAVATLSAAISFIIMHVTISKMLLFTGYILPDGALAEKVVAGTIGTVLGIQSLEMGVFGGIVVGLGVAALHNRFYKIELPVFLSFFGGIRFVPIICTFVFLLVGAGFFFVWPPIQKLILASGQLVIKSGYFGSFIYGFMERALIPFGLHHVFYMPFWQTGLGGAQLIDGVMVYGAQNIFFAELASPNTQHFTIESARFLTGKYPFMIAGLPGAALAMYHTAKTHKKKLVGGLLFSAALTSFLTGITEPIEFTFLFVAPVVFIIHCGFAGIAFVLTHLLQIAVGTTFSCGFIDLTLYGILQGHAKTNWMWLIPIFIVYFIGYYFFFRFVITKWNLMTPGREPDEQDTKLYTKADYQAKQQDGKSETTPSAALPASKDEQLETILQGLGGKDNIENLDSCATRLRLNVKDPSLVNKDLLKKGGALGVLLKGNGLQVVFGPKVSSIKPKLEEYINKMR
ncbi:PTS system, glucose-like IIB subunint [Elusimicrobium minutum Pei191]|uniref:PTS system, glucose-like IIB subunint n=1 Tax=Elusimicrobium minutum (strain Pei191) TaxID=445932 RepID=B2KD78_ELUMP|nr:PTS transporter subunit EIIC [Elusimicrobium minutum]ACC98474.1 PTS system, glucose-like IIB subunint [Elusimicrobium minutum Pei191]